jgi:hypothetical protein
MAWHDVGWAGLKQKPQRPAAKKTAAKTKGKKVKK